MKMKNNFYLTLISNSSLDLYPNNKASSFTVHLPHKIILNENWVVGLAELQYSYNFFNVSEGQNTFTYTNGTYSSTRSIREGYYKSVSAIINEVLKETNDLGDWLQLDSATNRVRIKLTDEITLPHSSSDDKNNKLRSFKFHGRLALQLGFMPDSNILKIDLSPYVGNVYFGIPDQMLVYSDIIEPQLIGYESSQVLKIVNTTEKEINFGASCYRGFEKIHYVPVLKKEFDKVDIDIRDITGNFFPFRHGISSVKLHFTDIKEN